MARYGVTASYIVLFVAIKLGQIMHTNFIENMRALRKRLGIKISQMPALTGLTRQQYGKIEKEGNPSLSTLMKIAEGLDAMIVLVPKAKADAVCRVLSQETQPVEQERSSPLECFDGHPLPVIHGDTMNAPHKTSS